MARLPPQAHALQLAGMGVCWLSASPDSLLAVSLPSSQGAVPLPGHSSLSTTTVSPQELGLCLLVTSPCKVTGCHALDPLGLILAQLQLPGTSDFLGSASASHPSLSVAFAGRDGDIAGPPVAETHRALCPGPGVFQLGAEPPLPAAPGQAAPGPRKLLGVGMAEARGWVQRASSSPSVGLG